MVSNIQSTNYLDKAKNTNNSQKSYSTSYLKEQPKQDMVEISTPKRAQKAKKFKVPQKSAPFDWKMALAIGGCIIAGAAMIRGGLPKFKVGGKSQEPVEELKNLVFQNIGADKKVKSFSELSGLEELKEISKEIKLALGNRKLASEWDLDNVSTRHLLYGPPGTGKTTIVKAIAKDLNADFVEISKTDFNSKYVAEPAQNFVNMMDQIIKHAQENPNKPVVVLMDEIDSIIATDTSSLASHSEEVLNAFKTKTLEIEQKCPNVFIFGTTNKSVSGSASDNVHIQINSAILDRFKESMHIVPRPLKDDIKNTLTYHLSRSSKTKNLFTETQLDKMAQEFEHLEFSYREINAIIKGIKKHGFVTEAGGGKVDTKSLKAQIIKYLDEPGKKVYFDDYLQKPKDHPKIDNAIQTIKDLLSNT